MFIWRTSLADYLKKGNICTYIFFKCICVQFFLLFLKLRILILYNLSTSSAVVPSPRQSEFTGTNHTHGSSGIRNPDWSFGSYRSFFFFFLVCLKKSEKKCGQKNIFIGCKHFFSISHVENYILQAHYQYQHNFFCKAMVLGTPF